MVPKNAKVNRFTFEKFYGNADSIFFFYISKLAGEWGNEIHSRLAELLSQSLEKVFAYF